ncbi:hypothetical protein ABPG75_010511, partial [Micractinium tetrahymenae]
MGSEFKVKTGDASVRHSFDPSELGTVAEFVEMLGLDLADGIYRYPPMRVKVAFGLRGFPLRGGVLVQQRASMRITHGTHGVHSQEAALRSDAGTPAGFWMAGIAWFGSPEEFHRLVRDPTSRILRRKVEASELNITYTEGPQGRQWACDPTSIEVAAAVAAIELPVFLTCATFQNSRAGDGDPFERRHDYSAGRALIVAANPIYAKEVVRRGEFLSACTTVINVLLTDVGARCDPRSFQHHGEATRSPALSQRSAGDPFERRHDYSAGRALIVAANPIYAKEVVRRGEFLVNQCGISFASRPASLGLGFRSNAALQEKAKRDGLEIPA